MHGKGPKDKGARWKPLQLPCQSEFSAIRFQGKPDAVADAAIDGCQTERAQATAFAKSCGASPYDTTGEREMIISMVEDVRSRADFLWYHGEAWQKGSCSPQDPIFWAAVTAHFKCMGTGDWREASQIRSLGFLGQAALAQCATKETPIRERVTQCQSADAAAIMSAYQAAAQEVTSIVALEPVLQQAMPKNASKALRADKLYYLRESYDACVIFETKARAVAGGDAAAILLKAAKICLAARLDLVDYAQQYLSPEERHAILSIADVEATNMAKLELEAVGIKTASPSDR